MIYREEEAADRQQARGDIDMPHEHSEAGLVAKRAILTGIEIDLVTEFLMETNPIELRTKLQQVVRTMRHHGLDETASLHRTIFWKVFAALSGLLSHKILHVSKDCATRSIIAGHRLLARFVSLRDVVVSFVRLCETLHFISKCSGVCVFRTCRCLFVGTRE